jgi:hypothetical protein
LRNRSLFVIGANSAAGAAAAEFLDAGVVPSSANATVAGAIVAMVRKRNILVFMRNPSPLGSASRMPVQRGWMTF